MKKRKIGLIIAIIAVILIVAAIISIYISMNPKETGIAWPKNDYTASIPVPVEGSVKETAQIDKNTYAVYMYWSKQEAQDYGNVLKDAGFEVTTEKSYNAVIVSGYVLKAQNVDGVQVSLESSSWGSLGAIKIINP